MYIIAQISFSYQSLDAYVFEAERNGIVYNWFICCVYAVYVLGLIVLFGIRPSKTGAKGCVRENKEYMF